MAGLTLKLSILDTDVFINLAKACKRIVADDRVPPEHKQAIQAALDDARQRKDGPAKIYYECDHRACKQGCNTHSGGMCNATLDIRHAKNFEMDRHGCFREKSAITYERIGAGRVKSVGTRTNPETGELEPFNDWK